LFERGPIAPTLNVVCTSLMLSSTLLFFLLEQQHARSHTTCAPTVATAIVADPHTPTALPPQSSSTRSLACTIFVVGRCGLALLVVAGQADQSQDCRQGEEGSAEEEGAQGVPVDSLGINHRQGQVCCSRRRDLALPRCAIIHTRSSHDQLFPWPALLLARHWSGSSGNVVPFLASAVHCRGRGNFSVSRSAGWLSADPVSLTSPTHTVVGKN
jgi:hypothetical protein